MLLLGQPDETRKSPTMTNDQLKSEIYRLEGELLALSHQLFEWQRVATRLAHAYRDNSIQESTRAFVEYARLKAQMEGKQ